MRSMIAGPAHVALSPADEAVRVRPTLRTAKLKDCVGGTIHASLLQDHNGVSRTIPATDRLGLLRPADGVPLSSIHVR